MNYLKIASLLEELAKEFRAGGPPAHSGSVAQPAPAAAEAKPDKLEIKLEDLQKIGSHLIRDGRAEELKAALVSLGLKSLSTAPKDKYTEIYGHLHSL